MATVRNFWLKISVRSGETFSEKDVLKKSDFQDGLGLLYQNANNRDVLNSIRSPLPPDYLSTTDQYRGLQSIAGLSLNKKKRWLLPELLKQHITEKEQTKSMAADSDCLPTVTLVERCMLDSEIVGRKADCTAIYTTGSTLGIYKKHSKHTFSQEAELRKEVGLDKETPEICYEVGYSFPKKSNEVTPRNSNRRFKKEKERVKWEGKENKGKFPRLVQEEIENCLDGEESCDFEDEKETYGGFEDENPHTRSLEVPLACFISCSKRPKKRGKKMKKDNNSSNMNVGKRYGKGDAIFVDRLDTEEGKHQENKTSTFVDVSYKLDKHLPMPFVELEVKSLSVCAEELIKDYRDSFEFSHTYPEKLVIDLYPKLSGLNLNPDNFTAKLLISLPLQTNKDSSIVTVAVILSAMSEPLISVNKSLCRHLARFGPKPLTLKEIADESASFLMRNISPDEISKPECISSLPAALPLSTVHKICNVKVDIIDPINALEKKKDGGCSDDCKRCGIQNWYSSVDDGAVECGVCLTENNGEDAAFFCLKECHHWFCDKCWKQYITMQLELSQIRITCPALKCNSHVNDTLVFSMVPDMYPSFKHWKDQQVLTMSGKYLFCPGKNCQRVASITKASRSNKTVPVSCTCGELWCVQCHENAHWPASCDVANEFNKKLKAFGLTSLNRKINSVFIKKCPKCNYPIEKYFGCSHMSCICGHEFCWKCMLDYNSHDYELCKKIEEQDQEEVNLFVFTGKKHMVKFGEMAFTYHRAESPRSLKIQYRNLKLMKHSLEIYRAIKSKYSFSNNYYTAWYESLLTNNSLDIYQKALDFKCQANFVLKNIALTLSVCPKQKVKNKIKHLFEALQVNVEHVESMLGKNKKKLGDTHFIKSLEQAVKAGENIIKNMRNPTYH